MDQPGAFSPSAIPETERDEGMTCPRCGGSGVAGPTGEHVACPQCGGSGVVPEPADVETLDAHAQTGSDRDQTSSDHDQTWSDSDQTESDRDQRSADEDQQAADAEFAAGSDAVAHERTTSARARTSRDRAAVSRLRDETAAARFDTAEDRDKTAEIRDREADERDRQARAADVPVDDDATVEEVLHRVERERTRAAVDRARAAEDRARAVADRNAAARDREEAHRAQAEARHNLVLAATDELTGTWTRGFGLASIAREIERAHRTGGRLVLAFIDVDRLKEVNDKQGHPEGDKLLRLTAETVRANVRVYDVIVRYGGDEFLCAMPGLTLDAADKRMESVAAKLRTADPRHSISYGLAQYDPGDELDELVGRADADLLRRRRSRGRDPG